MKVFLVDNYDSFTYNLVYLLRGLGAQVEVRRNDDFKIGEIDDFDAVVISPGPGIPEEAGNTLEVIRQYSGKKRIFGVCLGHQAIAEVFGAKLENMRDVSHGKSVSTSILDPGERIFGGIENPFPSGRYHSWTVQPCSVPPELKVTAQDLQGRIMALRHVAEDTIGVQFHPESILTPSGERILSNWLEGGK